METKKTLKLSFLEDLEHPHLGAWWTIITTPKRLRLEDGCEFEASLDWTLSTSQGNIKLSHKQFSSKIIQGLVNAS